LQYPKGLAQRGPGIRQVFDRMPHHDGIIGTRRVLQDALGSLALEYNSPQPIGQITAGLPIALNSLDPKAPPLCPKQECSRPRSDFEQSTARHEMAHHL